MKKQTALAFLLILSLLTPICGQQQTPASSPATSPQDRSADNDGVVRITTNLVQFDAVVTDRKGRLVTDLKPEDFEIYEDGRLQAITNFSYIPLQPAAAPKSSAADAPAKSAAIKNAPPVPPVQLRQEQVRRTIALVVDDLGLSHESIYFVRRGLKKFVDEQMQPGDLIAIVRTGAGIGALQQFTSDKRLLYAAIEQVKWNPRGRRGVSAFAPRDDNPLDTLRNRPNPAAGESAPHNPNTGNIEREATDLDNDFRDQIFSVGTLGALNFVVRGLRELPGRKSVVLMSDNLSLFEFSGAINNEILHSVRDLTDLANRASVVIYAMDARGLPTLNISSQDATGGITTLSNGSQSTFLSGPSQIEFLNKRDIDYFKSQSGLSYLAQQTGGFFIQNDNFIDHGLGRVLDDQKGFYLIGYRPDESTFDPQTGNRRYHTYSARVKNRPDLSVRTRTGFYGITDEQARPVHRTRESQLLAAIASPFSFGAIDMRLTSLFLNDETEGSFVRSMIYVDGKSLTFAPQPDGAHKTAVDVIAMTFGADGNIVDDRFRTETITVRGKEYDNALRNGLIFGINLPIKKAGGFQLRVAVRDAATERVGSASQFIEVPNLSKNRLTLSGLYLAGSDHHRQQGSAPRAVPAAANSEGETSVELDPRTGPAVRRFRSGALVDYGYDVYNAQLDNTTHRAQLQSQVRLFRDNQQVFAGRATNISGQANSKRLTAFGRLQLIQNLPPGEYLLQVLVTDTLAAKEKQRLATQWIAFDIEP